MGNEQLISSALTENYSEKKKSAEATGAGEAGEIISKGECRM